jgi:hypothetical protein
MTGVDSPSGIEPGTGDPGLQRLQQVQVVRWQLEFGRHEASRYGAANVPQAVAQP